MTTDAPWTARVLTLFPEMFPGPLGHSLAGRALERDLWRLDARDIRAHALDRHHMVDDTPAGGGPGMVMKPDVIAAAIDAARGGFAAPTLYLSPRGKPLAQDRVKQLAEGPGVILLCGRFEGVDQRVIDGRQLEEVSIGDFVLSGGEPAALCLIDAVVRLIPGVMGAAETLAEESFTGDLLEYPHYTRPQEWEGRRVPEILLSGHHGRINSWRREQAERLTRERRPDLWSRYLARQGQGKRSPDTHNISDSRKD